MHYFLQDELCKSIRASGVDYHKNLEIVKNYLLRLFVSQTVAQMEIDEGTFLPSILRPFCCFINLQKYLQVNHRQQMRKKRKSAIQLWILQLLLQP